VVDPRAEELDPENLTGYRRQHAQVIDILVRPVSEEPVSQIRINVVKESISSAVQKHRKETAVFDGFTQVVERASRIRRVMQNADAVDIVRGLFQNLWNQIQIHLQK